MIKLLVLGTMWICMVILWLFGSVEPKDLHMLLIFAILASIITLGVKE